MTSSLIQLSDLLGYPPSRRAALRTPTDLEAWVTAGIPGDAIRRAGETLSPNEMSTLLGISRRSYYHVRDGAALSPTASDRFYRFASVLARATTVFGTREKALKWLRTPLPALAGATPITKLTTEIGTQRVTEVLGSIEYGVYA